MTVRLHWCPVCERYCEDVAHRCTPSRSTINWPAVRYLLVHPVKSWRHMVAVVAPWPPLEGEER